MRGHMQRKWCRHCTYNSNDSPAFVFIASQKTQSELHGKINWRPLRYCVFIFPKYPPYFAAMYISQQVEIISPRWYSIAFFREGLMEPVIHQLLFILQFVYFRNTDLARDVQWIQSWKIRRRNVEVATKVPVAVCTRSIERASWEGDKKIMFWLHCHTTLLYVACALRSRMPVAEAFSVMEWAPIQRQRDARVGKGDSWYDDRTIVSMKPFLRSYGH